MSAHSRLFSPETLYAEGAAPVKGVDPPARAFPFARDEGGSTPRAPFAFFDWLFADARERWGMRMYEQDWTSTIYRWSSPKCTPLQRLMKVDEIFAYSRSNGILQSNVSAGRDWMVGMGLAGERNGVGVGHGSPWSGGVLQMVEAGAARWAFSSPNPCTDAAVAANWRISRLVCLADFSDKGFNSGLMMT